MAHFKEEYPDKVVDFNSVYPSIEDDTNAFPYYNWCLAIYNATIHSDINRPCENQSLYQA